jgi:hypothetical protein
VLRAAAFFDGEPLLGERRAAIEMYAPAHLAGAIAGRISLPRMGGAEGVRAQ